MSKNKITARNCNTIVETEKDYGDIYSMASAWSLTYKYCKQEGMKTKLGKSGIEQVISFIENKIKKAK